MQFDHAYQMPTQDQQARIRALYRYWIDHVPHHRANLKTFGRLGIMSPDQCGAVACLGGWAPMVPALQAEGLRYEDNKSGTFTYKGATGYVEPLGLFFGGAADRGLFNSRGGSAFDDHVEYCNEDLSDWEIAKSRLERFADHYRFSLEA